MMPTGLRDKLVTIEHLAQPDAKGPSGLPVERWTALGAEWMSKQDVSGSERLAGAQMSAVVDAEFEMPYWPSMDPDLVDVPKLRRLVFAGRIYNNVRPIKAPRAEGENIRLITSTRSAIAAYEAVTP